MKKTVFLFMLIISGIYALEDDGCARSPFNDHSRYRLPFSLGYENFTTQRSPGDSIGYTFKDLHEYIHGKRIMVDDSGWAYIVWMYMDYSQTYRSVALVLRDPDGTFIGPVEAVPTYSGFPQIDIIPASQKMVIASHVRDINNQFWSYLDIDSAAHSGWLPNEPKQIPDQNHIWPYVAVSTSGNILIATGDYGNLNVDNLYRTTDQGNTWALVDSFLVCVHPSQFVVASPFSDKIAFVNTRFTDGEYEFRDNDIWYMISTDGGINWDPYTNLTDYHDMIRAFARVDAAFDLNDNLHIVWEAISLDSTHYGSKIFHWDQYRDTITVVNSPSLYYGGTDGWWVQGPNSPNCYGLPTDGPQIVIDQADPNYIYCLWHGNDDYNDVSYEGCFNGELYGSYSSDKGVTWSPYVNLTNTRSPGAGSGYCLSEDFMTANSYTFHDSIFLSYMVDRDAGHYSCWGQLTCNPVYCWIFNKNRITTGVLETPGKRISHVFSPATIIRGSMKIPADLDYRLFDIMGRRLDVLDMTPGIYFLEIEGSIPQKIVKVR